MQIIPWIWIAILIFCAWPLALWLLKQTSHPYDWLLTLAVTLGLSTGTLALVMFWDALFDNYIDGSVITLVYCLIMLVGAALYARSSRGNPLRVNLLPRIDISRVKHNVPFLIVVGLIGAAILFNALYWPFYRSDAVSIYADQAHFMYAARTFIPLRDFPDLAYYQAYPPLVPFVYTYTYLVSGWENEYLAKIFPTLLSLGCVLNVFLLGRMWRGAAVGKVAALLLIITPSFARWASSGYVDLPMAFFYTLAAIFAWRLIQSGNTTDAALAGLIAGLAAWTKNVGLLSILCFVGWLLIEHFRKKVSIRTTAVFTAIALVIVAPWYLRNWIEAQLIFPPTIWVDQAERNLSSLLIFVNAPQNFAVSGFVVMAALMFIPIRALRSRYPQYDVVMFLCLTIPFFGFWWVFASYDPRFLLLFLPFLCVLGAEWITFVFGRLSAWQKKAGLFAFYGAIVLMGIYCVWISVDFKTKAVQNLFMSDAEKQVVVLATPQP